jgi:hypothetical protein
MPAEGLFPQEKFEIETEICELCIDIVRRPCQTVQTSPNIGPRRIPPGIPTGKVYKGVQSGGSAMRKLASDIHLSVNLLQLRILQVSFIASIHLIPLHQLHEDIPRSKSRPRIRPHSRISGTGIEFDNLLTQRIAATVDSSVEEVQRRETPSGIPWTRHAHHVPSSKSIGKTTHEPCQAWSETWQERGEAAREGRDWVASRVIVGNIELNPGSETFF